jgi:hypothetical protein
MDKKNININLAIMAFIKSLLDVAFVCFLFFFMFLMALLLEHLLKGVPHVKNLFIFLCGIFLLLFLIGGFISMCKEHYKELAENETK